MSEPQAPAPAPDADARLAAAGHRHGGALGLIVGWWLRNRTAYEAGRGDERPLTGYALLVATYSSAVLLAVALLAVRRRRSGGPAPALPTPGELALLGAATFQISRTAAHDSVVSPLRSPFTTFERAGAPGEVLESPRDGAVRHAVGELVTCPFCLAQWVATALLAGHAAAPRATRWVSTTFAVVAAANALQSGYGLLQGAAEG